MSRSVVLGKTFRCEHCRFPPRWCICDGFAPIECPLQVKVLIHHREYWKPTSTGRLINRVIPSSCSQIYRTDLPLIAEPFLSPDRPLWILHPLGEPLPELPPKDLQLLLLDGSWREASGMIHAVKSWGRLISLPMSGTSRYWLREQQSPGNYSTIEALLFLLSALGFQAAHDALRLQFELHVYAGLRLRGAKRKAEEYLATSPIRETFADLLLKLSGKRREA
jgi:DTW domain-containing protein YfiP